MVLEFAKMFPPAGENRGIHLYLPDDYYDSQERYPVLYMFDGHPVVVKPDTGVGASNTEKLTCDEQLRTFLASKPDVPFIMEESAYAFCRLFRIVMRRFG